LSAVIVSPKFTSSNSLVRSPNLTLEFTTPSSSNSSYNSFCCLVPLRGVCNAWYACLIAAPSGIIPFAVAKKLALTKFLICVTGDKIVFATCDKPFGYKTKL